MNKKPGLLARFFIACFFGLLAFWIVLIAENFLPAQIRNIPLLKGINFIYVGIGTGLFFFLWILIRSGLFRFMMTVFTLTTLIFCVVQSVQITTLINMMVARFTSVTPEPIYEEELQLSDETVPIWYVDDGDGLMEVSSELVDELVRFINVLPEELTEKAKNVYLVEEDAFMEKSELDNGMEVFGFSSSGSMSSSIRLVVNPQWNQYAVLKSGEMVSLNDPAFYKETIIHELSHLVDMIENSSRTNYSQNEDFIAIYERNPDSISEYGSTDPGEFFAEAAIYYYMYPELLMDKNQELFIYFNNLFGHY